MRYTWALWTLHHPLVGAQVPSAAGLGFGLSFWVQRWCRPSCGVREAILGNCVRFFSHGDIGDIKYSAYLATQHYSTLAPKKRKLGLAANKINTKSDSKLPGCPTSRHGDAVACGCIKRRKRRTWTWNRFRLTLREPSPCHAWHSHGLRPVLHPCNGSDLDPLRPCFARWCQNSRPKKPQGLHVLADFSDYIPRHSTIFHPFLGFLWVPNFDPSHAIPRWKRLWSPAEAAAQPIWERLLTNLLHLWKLSKSAGRQWPAAWGLVVFIIDLGWGLRWFGTHFAAHGFPFWEYTWRVTSLMDGKMAGWFLSGHLTSRWVSSLQFVAVWFHSSCLEHGGSPVVTMVVSNVSILSILNILNIQNMLIILKCSNSLKHEVWFPWLFQYVPMSPWLLWRSRLGLSERSRLTRQARDGENCSEREGHLKWV